MGVQVPPFALHHITMKCSVFCTASSYNIKPFFHSLKSHYPSTFYRDLVHIGAGHGDVFYFSHGCVVLWNIPKEQESEFLMLVKDYELQPIEEIENDKFEYCYGDALKIEEDVITLPNKSVLTKLAISHGLAQSAKLSTFESAIQKIFHDTKQIPQNLSKKGSISLSRREIRRKMGELFLERNSINLHVNVLDVPEFFWDAPEYEPLYMTVANWLDIENRVEVLNQRLAVVHELFEMLGTELNHQHSCRLEWAIILLIVIEVLLTLFRDVFRLL